MMRAFLSASHNTTPTRSNVMQPLRRAPSATVANSSSERTAGPVRRTFTPCSVTTPTLVAWLGRGAERGRHLADHCRCLASRLQIVEIEDRIDVHEAPKLRGLRRPAGDQFTPGESRALSFRQAFECISKRSEGRLEVFQLCFPQAHTLERLRQRTENTA